MASRSYLIETPPLLERRDGMIHASYATGGTVLRLVMRPSTFTRATMEARQFLIERGA